MDFLELKIRWLKRFVSSEEFVSYLNKKGVKCGLHTKFFDIKNTFIDTQRPWLLEIGDYCKITRGVTILQHDYSRSVLRRVYGEVIDTARPTRIGNNVFIGMNSTILMGSSIGDNVIIGAGSVVGGVIPSNCVAGGVPARVLCSLDEFYQKRKNLYVNEAKETARMFFSKYGRFPTVGEMGAFFPIYLKRDIHELKENNILTNMSGDDEQQIIESWLKTQPLYSSYEDFLREC